MILGTRVTIALIFVAVAASTGEAQWLDVTAVCGGPAESISEQSKVTLEGHAQTLASSPNVTEEAKRNVDRIVDPRRSDVSRELHYLMSVSCAIVVTDHTLTTNEKLTKIYELRQLLQFPEEPRGRISELERGKLPAPAPVKVDNTSVYVGNGRWDWTIFVNGSPEEINGIKCVRYHLHPTFPDPDRKVCDPGSNNSRAFPLSSNGWGTFTVAIDLEGKDGSVERMLYPLRFSER